MSDPTRLTVQQLLPLAVAIEYRKRGQSAQLPPCPTCHASPCEITGGTGLNPFNSLIFEHCGHQFTADADTAAEAAQQAATNPAAAAWL